MRFGEDQFINSVILIFSITGRCGFLTAPSIVRNYRIILFNFINRTESFAETVILHIRHRIRCGYKPHLPALEERCGYKPHLPRPWRNDAVTNRNLPALEERCGYKPQPTGPGGTMRLQTAPTGLGTAKLTLMVRFGNRAYRGWRFAKLPPLGFTMFNPYVSNANSCYTMFLIQLYNLHRSARRCL